MTYARRIESNLKGEFKLDLGQRTLLVGGNEAGKSRAIDALCLALTGRIRSPHIGSREHDIIRLRPAGAEGVFTTAELDNGDRWHWECKGSEAKVQRAVWEHPNGATGTALVSDAALEILKGSVTGLREAIIRSSAASGDRADVIAAAPENIRGALGKALDAVCAGRKQITPDDLAEAVRWAEAQRRLRKKEQTATEARLAGIVENPLTEAEVGELEHLRELMSNPAAQPPAMPDTAKIENALAAERSLLEEKQVALAQAPAPAAASSEITQYFANLLFLAQGTRQQLQADGKTSGYCPLCGNMAALAQLEVRLQQIQNALRGLQADVVVLGQRRALEHDVQRIGANVQVLQVELHRAHQIAQVAADAPPAPDPKRYEELAVRQRAITEALAARECITALAKAHQELTGVIGWLKASRDRVLEDTRVRFLEALNAGLPEGVDADLVLQHGQRQVCDLRINTAKKQGIPVTGLSGAQRVMVAAAVCLALDQREEGNLRLAVIDDVWFDPPHLEQTLEALDRVMDTDESITQTIVCAVALNSTRVPAGWHVVRLEALQQSA